MAKKALCEKAKRKKRFKVRDYHRCPICGRARGYMGKFDMCRICFRKIAHVGQIPGITKSSW